MRHLGTCPIKTARLIMRRFTVDDAEAMYRNWAGDPDVTKYLMWPTHENVDISRTVLEDWVSHYGESDFYLWAIALRDRSDDPIGSISVVRRDDAIGMAQIGYCIGKQWWNRGIVSEALSAVIRYLFIEVGANRIEARHDPNNPGSGKVMCKCGMRYEGTMREADWNNTGICDCSMYAILKKNYSPRPE